MDPTDATRSTDSKRNSLPGSKGTLNVILHGLYIILVKDEITVYIPNMGSDHTYRAGNWLAETTLDAGDFSLEGTNSPTPDKHPFKPEDNILLRDVRVTDANCCDRVYATLHLPLPKSVQSLGKLSVPEGGIGGDSEKKIADNSGKFSARVQILTYDFESDANLRLGEHPWEPVFDDGFVNLHVFSEPDQTPEDDHVRHAFQMSMGLFMGVDLSLRKPLSPAVQSADGEKSTPGVHPLELQSLILRLQWLAVIGRAIKDHRDLNKLWDDPVAFNDDGSCSGAGIGDDGN
jgi:hypothetical protein